MAEAGIHVAGHRLYQNLRISSVHPLAVDNQGSATIAQGRGRHRQLGPDAPRGIGSFNGEGEAVGGMRCGCDSVKMRRKP